MTSSEVIESPTADVPRRRAPVVRALSSARDALRRFWVEITVSLVLVVVTFPNALRLRPSLDSSWVAGLQMAATRDLVFGKQVVFTYGPLGYLNNAAIYVTRPGVLSVLMNVTVTFILAFVTIRLLRARFSALPAVALAAVLVIVLRSEPAVAISLVMLAVAWAIWWVLRDRPSVGPVVAMAVIFAPSILVKFSCVECMIVLGTAVVIAASLDGGLRRAAAHAAVFVVAAIGSLGVAWVLAGQPLSALPTWFARSLDVADGYSDAMGLLPPTSRWIFPVGGVLLALALGAACTARELSTGRRTGLVVLLVITALVTYKESVVRQQGVLFFFVGVIVVVSLLPLFDRRLAVASLALALLPVLALKTDYGEMLDLSSRFSAISTMARFSTSSSYRSSFLRSAQSRILGYYDVPDSMLSAASGHTVDIEPAAMSIAYADPRMRWDPSPVLQSYVAYTPELDGLNAKFLRGDRAPDFVLRQPEFSIDDRLARFESPDATLALMCHYREQESSGTWQLFARSGDRCGAAREMRTVETELGRRVQVPEPSAEDRIVVARFHGLADSAEDRLQSVTSRGVQLWFGADRWNRFLQGTQGDTHIMSMPACAREALDGPNPIAARSFVMSDRTPKDAAAVGNGSNVTTRTHDSYRVTFSEIPYRC